MLRRLVASHALLALLLGLSPVAHAAPATRAAGVSQAQRPASRTARRPRPPREAELRRDVYRTPAPGRRIRGMTLREKFGSVWLAGFESSSQQIRPGGPHINALRATQHARLVRQDYRRLRQVGIKAARESVSWDVADRGDGTYDFRSFDRAIAAGKEFGITQIWDLFHYGYPDDVDPFSDAFVRRFARYSGAAAERLKPHLKPGQIAYFTPVNEISFYAWGAGDNGLFAPFAHARGDDLKRQLVKAWIASADAIWQVIPDAQMVTAEPIMVRHAAAGATAEQRAEVERSNDGAVRQAFDMLSGRAQPELGGSPRHLGIIGANYYPHKAQVMDGVGTLASDDPRQVPFEDVLVRLRDAYPDHQVLVTETMDDGAPGARWVRRLTAAKKNLSARGIDDVGFTLYPALRMPDWYDQSLWYQSGLWDLQKDGSRMIDGEPRRKRVLRKPMNEALQQSIREIDADNATPASRRIAPTSPTGR